jgi:hypothetical protein
MNSDDRHSFPFMCDRGTTWWLAHEKQSDRWWFNILHSMHPRNESSIQGIRQRIDRGTESDCEHRLGGVSDSTSRALGKVLTLFPLIRSFSCRSRIDRSARLVRFDNHGDSYIATILLFQYGLVDCNRSSGKLVRELDIWQLLMGRCVQN